MSKEFYKPVTPACSPPEACRDKLYRGPGYWSNLDSGLKLAGITKEPPAKVLERHSGGGRNPCACEQARSERFPDAGFRRGEGIREFCKRLSVLQIDITVRNLLYDLRSLRYGLFWRVSREPELLNSWKEDGASEKGGMISEHKQSDVKTLIFGVENR